MKFLRMEARPWCVLKLSTTDSSPLEYRLSLISPLGMAVLEVSTTFPMQSSRQ